LAEGSWVPVQHSVAYAEDYLRTKWHLDPCSRLTTIDVGHKLGAPPLFRRGAGSLSTTKLSGLRPTSVTSGILMHPDVCPFFWRELGPHPTKSPGPRKTSIPSGILVHPAVSPQRTSAENWGLCTFRGGGAGSPSNTLSRRPRPTSVPSDISIHMQPFDHNRHAPKIAGSAVFGRGVWVPIYHKVAWAEAYLHNKWDLDAPSRMATIKMGRKLAALPPTPGVGAGSPSNTMSSELRPNSVPSGILIHAAVWPQ